MSTPIGRDDEIETITSRLIEGRSVLLVGEAGVGKSHLAAAVARRIAAGRVTVESIIGSPSFRSVRFGAVQHLLGPSPHQSPHLPAVAVERHLRAIDRHRRVLLVVDDIDGIDDGSAAVVQSLASSGIVVLATVRTEAAAQPNVLPMWKDELMERVDVRALDVHHTAALAASFLGAPLDPGAVDSVATLTLGNPLFVREVLADARSVGSLTERDGLWGLTTRLSAHDRVSDLLAGRFQNLADGEREALELVAVGEQLPAIVLQRVTETQHLESLERGGLVTLGRVGGIDVVRTSHPLVGEVVRATTSDLGVRRLSSVLSEAILQDDEPRPADLVRAVDWSIDGVDQPSPDAAAAAAGVALRTFDGSAARRFVDASGLVDSPTLVMLGRAHLLEQEPQLALDALTRAEAAALTDSERSTAAAARAEVLLFALGDGSSADRVLNDALADVEEPNARAALAGVVMLGAALRGDFQPALGLGRTLLGHDELDDHSRLSVIRMTTLAQVMTGRTDGLADDFDSGIALARAAIEADPVTHMLLQIMKWLWSIDEIGLDATRRVVTQVRHDPARPAGLTALDDSTIALLSLFAGDGAEAARSSSLALGDESIEVVGMGSLLRAQSAWIHASAGADDLAMSMHDAALGHPQSGPRERAYLGCARATVLANNGSLDAAIDECRRASAESCDHRLWSVWLLYLAVRVGRADAVLELLEAEQQFADTAFTGVMIKHARALTDESPIALTKVADAFVRQGALVFAAEAFAQAARLVDDVEESARLGQRAWTCFDRCNQIRSHEMDGLERPLSVRETEVARLAASGITSREIASALFVSQRTVDNHLRSVYRTFGVGQRGDLAPLFA